MEKLTVFHRPDMVGSFSGGIPMKTIIKDICTAAFMGFALPGMLLNLAVLWLDSHPRTAASQAPAYAETQPQTVALPMRLRSKDGMEEEMDLDTYLVGVLLGEMPASFEMEALKAQAVVARTYARKAWVTGGKHGDGSVCGSSACCQDYLTEGDYFRRGGTEEGLEKIRSAVLATSGLCLTYEGELIEATYFSASGGSTEDAAAVWGTDFPYLQAVSSPVEEGSPYDTDTVTFTSREFQSALGAALPGSPGSWFGPVTYTEGGGVASMAIGGETYSGTLLRSLLGLRSTDFEVSTEGECVTITTHGYGHRVGMSQYGADAMAAGGATFDEILAHYYPGTALTRQN